ncbi:MAG: metal ABC transporter permease [Pseudomonadota bacterium]
MDQIYSLLLEPLTHGFMQRALFMATIIGVVCAIFSCFLILKGWSLMGDAVSHAVLPGLALAYIAGLPLAIGAFVAGIVCALSTGYLKNNTRVKEDAVMGIVFSGMFALGLVLMTYIKSDIHLLHVLFGNVLGITPEDMIQTALIAGMCIVIMIVKRRDFMMVCFDPAHAQVIGLPVRTLNICLLTLLSLTIVAALQAAGIILVVAMLIAPGAIAFLLSRSFDRMMVISVSISVTSCIIGTLFSFHLDVAPAPLIVVLQAIVFLVVFVGARKRAIA